MKPEYEGLDFSALVNPDWKLLDYSISDSGHEGHFLSRHTRNLNIAFLRMRTKPTALRQQHHITEAAYWDFESAKEVIAHESIINELFGNLLSSDAPKLGQIIKTFTVGGANP